MDRHIAQVGEFHGKFGVYTRQSPTTDIPGDVKELRLRLLQEELDELKQAVGADDLVEVADALGDLLYLVFGTAHAFGMAGKLKEVFEEIHRSNMSKLGPDGRPVLREDGKVMKGPGFFKPNLAPILGRA